ncbi:Paraneoplastic antigen Ma1-like [Holothuria leucospilota]|uniref:Paraneoplastic antigen Ma1-like n=1 Tax=Holothuria leucospilota TaxID=206669 RepID=A0A9Q1C249_HOLLE|nr:Paraneoplastic antigen Ma1-like [Holothuria leucospilota]
MSNPETESEKFDRELEDFLAQHGKKREDIQFPGSDTATKTVVEHIHKIEDRALKKHDYKRLRGFSGKSPVPSGELPFSTWYLHAEQMLSESSLSEEEKRLRLSECLSPPALTLYRRAAEELGPLATGAKLLEQLGKAFGVACEGEDLDTLFRDTYQEREEAASAYLLRLDERLDQAIQFGGVDRQQADKLRLSQFIRGCIFSEGLVSNLQLRQRKSRLPTLVGLLREVRIEEAEETARLTRRENARAPKKAQVNHATIDKPTRTGSAKTVGKVPTDGKRRRAPVREQPGAPTAVVGSHTAPTGEMAGKSPREKEPLPRVPEGLVGDAPLPLLRLDGIECQALLDTGSQVTCVSSDFYRSRLSHRELMPLHDLGVTGAGGQDVPYLGYIQVDLTPSATDAGTEKTVTTLALVLPGNSALQQVPLLIGTNTSVLQTLLQDCQRMGGNKAATRAKCGEDGLLGPLRLRRHTEIPAGESIDLDCSVRNLLGAGTTVLVEAHPSLGGTLMVQPFLTKLTRKKLMTVKVRVFNVSSLPVKLGRRHLIGQAFLPASVEQISHDEAPSPQGAAATINTLTTETPQPFSLEGSPISEEWRHRIANVLKRHHKAFSTSDLDIGCTSAVKHKIRLSDDARLGRNADG